MPHGVIDRIDFPFLFILNNCVIFPTLSTIRLPFCCYIPFPHIIQHVKERKELRTILYSISKRMKTVTTTTSIAIYLALLLVVATTTPTVTHAFATYNKNIARLPTVASNNNNIRNLHLSAAHRDDDHGDDEEDEYEGRSISSSVTTKKNSMDRRAAMRGAMMIGLGLVSGISSSSSIIGANTANAFDKTFPEELTEADEQQAKPLFLDSPKRYTQGSRSNSVQRAYEASSTQQRLKNNVVNFNVKDDLLPSIVWGGAIWLLSGSRSNPLVTPIANILYNPKEEQWLKDRNDGLFGEIPIPLLFLLGIVFITIGTLVQYSILQLSQGDTNYTFQLAGVTLISGGFLELGRLASGEKKETREENDRTLLLKSEFDEFATKRLSVGGNCHRSDVVSAFRRYYGKYRQADNEQYPLSDLEIEQLLRQWNKSTNLGRAEMTSSGFYYGIQINKDADVFVTTK